MKKLLLAAVTGSALAFAASAQATPVMPSFAGAPAGWSVDRYAPNSFSDVGTYQGRNNVLGIGISSAQGLGSRDPCCNSTFYNTQGEGHAISGGAGSSLSAELYVPSSWGNAANGSIRTDEWGVMTDGTAVSDYSILGFTNYGGAARFRYWDEDLNSGNGDWVNLSAAVDYNAWNNLTIKFTGSSYEYFVNGALVGTDSTIDGSTGYLSVLMEAYNFFGDPSLTGANPADYTADWSNAAEVPEPASLALFGSGLLALGGLGLRRRKAAKKA